METVQKRSWSQGLPWRQSIALLIAFVLLSVSFGPASAQGGQQRAQRINFAPGAISATRTGVLTMGGMDRYVLKASEGQTLSVVVASANNNVDLVIFGKDGTVLISDHADATSWSGVLPSTQDYYIDVNAVDGTSANYTLTVTIPPEPPTPPQPQIQRIRFAPGTISARVSGQVTPGAHQEYVLKASANQEMLITTQAEEQAIGISVVGADGTVLQSPMGGLPTFSGELPSTQDYFITVQIQGSGFADYTMNVTIEPLVD
ncbi:MAG: hypothetical protein IPK16_04920 [Anaerolineales bacterium]|nr:hypothetical protein [Anaerolineales bacterium]